jgi:hypothetical protein
MVPVCDANRPGGHCCAVFCLRVAAEQVPVTYFIDIRNALPATFIFYILPNLPVFRLRPVV